MRSRTEHVLALSLLLSCLCLVCAVWFNRVDLAITAITTSGADARIIQGDAEIYVRAVQYYRGEASQANIPAPHIYRPLMPMLARVLPFPPLTALNAANLAALAASVGVLYFTLLFLGVRRELILAGCLVFIVSFPCFYYGTIGYVDPGLLLFLTLFVFALCVRRNWLALLALFLGLLAKESMLLTLPALIAAQVVGKDRSLATRTLWLAAGFAIAAIPLVGLRMLTPLEADLFLPVSFGTVPANASRGRAWLSVMLSFGVPGILASILLLRKDCLRRLISHPTDVPLLVGAAGGVLLVTYAWAAAFVDGRFAWTIYPFCIPMIAIMLTDTRSEVGRSRRAR